MIMRYINDFYGIVWSINGNKMKIALPRGGFIDAPIKEGIKVGDNVAFIMDPLDRNIVEVMPKDQADHIVKCWLDPLLDIDGEPPEEEDIPDVRDAPSYEKLFWDLY